MSAADVIPPDKLTELVAHHERAERENRSGLVTLRLRYHRGKLSKSAVVPEFEDEVQDAG